MTTPAICNTRNRSVCHKPEPSPDEVKRGQTATAGALRRGKLVAKEVVKETLMEIGAHRIEHAAERSGNAAAIKAGRAIPYVAIAVSAVKGTLLLNEIINVSREEGKELNEAYAAQSRDVAILMIVAQSDPKALPEGYLAHRAAVAGATGFQHPAFKTATDIASRADRGDPDAVELRDVVVRDFNMGRMDAYAGNITGRPMLDKTLKSDAQFKERFDSDPVFRQGVLAAMDEATRDRASFDQNVAMVSSQRYWSTARP